MKKYKTFVNLSGWNKVMSKKIILSLALTLLLTTIGTAAINVNSGMTQTAIQNAITSASDGNEVIFADGTYNMSGFDLGTVYKNITLRSASKDPAKCTINCGGAGRAFYLHAGETEATVIQGFTILNGSVNSGSTAGGYGGAIECYMTSPTIDNCVFKNCNAEYGGAIDIFYGSPVIKNCIFTANGGPTTQYGSAIECAGLASEPSIQNCLFYGNIITHGFGTLDFYDNCAPQIANSTIADNSGANYIGGINSANSDVTVVSSIVWGNSSNLSGNFYTVSYSCVQGGFSGYGNKSTDPLFKTGPSGNYYLSHTSAGQLTDSNCIDAGMGQANQIFVPPANSFTTSTNSASDTGVVDMGFHYPKYTTALPQLKLTTNITPAGTGTLTKTPNDVNFVQYSEVKIKAVPNGGYRFMDWLEGTTPTPSNTIPGPNDTLIEVMDANKTVVANFSTTQMYKLTTFIKGEHGTITNINPNYFPDANDPCSHYIPRHTNATITVLPNIGYIVKQWYKGNTAGFNINDANTYSVLTSTGSNFLTTSIDANTTIAVEFIYKTYLLTTFTDSNGTISPRRGYYPAGTTVNLVATPKTGYRVSDWKVNSVVQNLWNVTALSVVMDANKTVNVQFELGHNRVIHVFPDSNGIQNAIDDANNGDTIQIHPGTYVGTGIRIGGDLNNPADPNHKAITIVGDPANPENVIIDCTGEVDRAIFIRDLKPVIINGITIANINIGNPNYIPAPASSPDQPGSDGGWALGLGIYMVGANHQISNCHIRNVYGYSDNAGNGADANTTLVNGSYGGDGGWIVGAAVLIDYPCSPTFKNVLISDCCAIGGNGGNGGKGRDAALPDPNVGIGGQGGLGGAAYGAGIACWSGTNPTFINCTITNCHAYGGKGGNGGDSGRGYRGAYGGLANVTGLTGAWKKDRNDPNGWGGTNIGISFPNNIFFIENLLATLNYDANFMDITDYSAKGSGIYVGRNCTAKFINCTFSGNTTEGCVTGLGGHNTGGVQEQPRKNYHTPSYGSGVFADKDSNAIFIGCNVNANEVFDTNNRENVKSDGDGLGGGSIAGDFTKLISITDCNIYENFSPLGGGIYSDWTQLKVLDSNVSGNISYSGGGILTVDSNVFISSSTITGNAAGTQTFTNIPTGAALFGSGGGIYALSSLMDINDSTITSNSCRVTGGGICLDGDWWVDPQKTPLVKNCLITENSAGSQGGGVAAIYYAEPTVQNCTVVSNNVTEADGSGGGIFASYSAEVTVTDTIFWNNSGIKGSQIGLSSGGEFTDMPASLKVSYSDVDLRNKTQAPASVSSSSSSSASSAGKLIEQQTIYDQINSKGQADVIVTLADIGYTTNWSSSASISGLHSAVAAQQTKVLSTLSASDFTLRSKLENSEIFSGAVSASGLTKLISNSNVAHIEPVRTAHIMLRQAIPLGDALASRPTYNGADCSIAIVDTGIDYRHPRLGGGGFPNAKVIGGYDFGDGDNDPLPGTIAPDTCHGTCCAGIAAGDLGTVGDYIGGVAYGAKLYALKVTLNEDPGQGFPDYATLGAWDWCVSHKDDDPAHPLRVMSNSWGIYGYPINNSTTADNLSPAHTKAAKTAISAGITLLAASGNDSFAGQGISWPSAMSTMISVGAVYDVNGQVTNYSNTANNLNILAPADPVYTTDIIGAPGRSSGDYYPYFNGTSSATPFAAGCVAALQSAAVKNLGYTLAPDQVKDILIRTGKSVTDKKVAITKPMVDLGAAIALISENTPVYVDDPRCSLVGVVQDAAGKWTVDGSSNISKDPNFVLGYYLSNINAGQKITSPCVDSGSIFASLAALNGYTTRTDGIRDAANSYVDMGYHYKNGLTVYNLTIDVNTVAAGGTTNPAPGVHKQYDGEVVTITAIPAANSRVSQWIIDGVPTFTNLKTNTITMNAAHSVTVIFEFHTPTNLIVPDQYATIQEAIDKAENGDTIYIYPKTNGRPHYISDPCGLDFEGKAIRITSENPDDPNKVAETIIDCNNKGRAFIFRNGEDSNSIIEGLTITNGLAAGDIAEGTQIIVDPIDANLYRYDGISALGDGYGGAIFVGKNAKPTIRKCVFSNCDVTGGQGSSGGTGYTLPASSPLQQAGPGGEGGNGSGNGYGAVIYCDTNSSPKILNCDFKNNIAHGGIAGDGGTGGAGGGSKVAGNGGGGGNGNGNGYGGAIYCQKKSYPKIRDCSFTDNFASMGLGGIGGKQGNGPTPTQPPYPYDGTAGVSSGTGYAGVIYYAKDSVADINGCTFINNTTEASAGNTLSSGGAFYFEPHCSSLNIFNSTVSGNKSTIGSGGAIFLNANNNLKMSNCYLGGNSSNIDGGAMYIGSPKDANQTKVTFMACTFTGNIAQGIGGSIFAKNCDANFSECFVNRNTAQDGGGLYFVAKSNLKFVSGTISDNNAVNSSAEGGAVALIHVPATFINCQFMRNGSAYAGGAILFKGNDCADSTVMNCLFAYNNAGARGGAINTTSSANIKILNSTFSQNETAIGGAGGGVYASYASSPVIRDCIFDKNKRTAIYEGSSDSDPNISYCFFFGNLDGDFFDFNSGRTYNTAKAANPYAEMRDMNDLIMSLYPTNKEPNNLPSPPLNDANAIGDTIFRSGNLGDFYLKQKTKNYPDDHNIPAIDHGSALAKKIQVTADSNMGAYTTRVDSNLPDLPDRFFVPAHCTYDQFRVDIGFHYPDANFVKQFTLTTKVVGGRGTIEPLSGKFYAGSTVQLKATPDIGWRVQSWSGTDDDSITSTNNYVVMLTDQVVTVSFEQPKNIYLPGQYTTLQEAINASKSGDKIIISQGRYGFEDTTFDYPGVRIWNKDITITSANPDDPCVVAGTVFSATRFDIQGVGKNMILDGFTIADAHYAGNSARCPSSPPNPDGWNGIPLLGGAMRLQDASPTIRNVRFLNCSATGGNGSNFCGAGGDGGWGGYAQGGAVGLGSGSSPLFKNCKFINCVARGGNGGNGDPSINTPGHGGSWGDPNKDVDHTWSQYWDWPSTTDYDPNVGYKPYWFYSGYGGAVYCGNGSNPTFENCLFSGNTTYGGVCGTSCPNVWPWPSRLYVIDSFGGAVYLQAGSQAKFTDCNFAQNIADTRNQVGDANFVYPTEQTGWQLSDPVVSYGGAICAENLSAIPEFENCSFSSNVACAGGAMYVEGTVCHVDEAAFNNNNAMLGGALVLIDSNSGLSECRFTGNNAVIPPGQGGAIYSVSSSSQFYDCQIMGNTAGVSGGGAYFGGSGEPNMFNCLIVDNTSYRDGGGISANWDAQLHLNLCTIANNEVSGGRYMAGFGGGLSAAYEANVDMINCIFWNDSAENGHEISIGNNYEAADKRPAEVTVTYSDIQDGASDVFYDQANGCMLHGFELPTTNLYGTSLSTPSFQTRLPWGSYFLEAKDTNDPRDPQQTHDSNCINRGSDLAENLNMFKHTTRTDLKLDKAKSLVDLGYHYTRQSEIPGDFDFDGDVDDHDFMPLFTDYWMNDDCTFPYFCDGRDFNHDGEVDFKDYAIFAENWQRTEKKPPKPDPMTWAMAPRSASLTSIKMIATAAIDNSGSAIKYEFQCVSGGGHGRLLTDPNCASTSFTDSGLTAGVQYGYRVRAWDGNNNHTEWSFVGYAVAGEDSAPPVPNPMTWTASGAPKALDSNTASMTASTATDISGVEYYFEETTGHHGGTNSGWISSTTYVDTGLDPCTTYMYRVKARDKSANHNETAYSVLVQITTPAKGGTVDPNSDPNGSGDKVPPTPNPSQWSVVPTVYEDGLFYYHTMTAATATDAHPPVEYYFDCCDGGGTDSGWILEPTYTAGGFWAPTNSTYRVRTRDALGNVSEWSQKWNTYFGPQ